MFLSKKIANVLFGRHDNLTGDLSIEKSFTHPDGTKVVWPGNDGLIMTLVRRIDRLEKKLLEKDCAIKKSKV